MAESRVKKTLLNARVNLLFFLLALTFSFFSRKIFLDCLGADFIGLTGTLQNLLGFLNLAELGIGSAIAFVLYKPIFDQDHDKINEIISVMGWLYRWIGLIILGCGIILSCFLPLIFPSDKTGFSYPLIYFAYYSFLISSLIGYFINYRQNLLGADQRNYVVAGYFQTCNILKSIAQIAAAYYTGSWYLWVAIELSFGIIYSFILNWKINQTYPWLKSQISKGRKLLKKYHIIIVKTKQLFIHKIGSFVQFQITPFIIYIFVNLNIVAFYGNYSLIIDKLTQLVNQVLGSNTAGIGNLIAEGNKNKTISIFWELTNLQFFVAGICSFALLILINPFIVLWIGPKYLLSDTVLYLIILQMLIGTCAGTIVPFIWGHGMFGDIWSPLAEFILNLAFMIILGAKWGLAGIVAGRVLGYTIIYQIWKPIYLYKWCFKEKLIKYASGATCCYVSVLVSIFIMWKAIVPFIHINPYTSATSWILYAFISVGIFIILLASIMYLLNPGMRRLIKRFLS